DLCGSRDTDVLRSRGARRHIAMPAARPAAGGLRLARGGGSAQGADRNRPADRSVRDTLALRGKGAAAVAAAALGSARPPAGPLVGASPSVDVDGAVVLVGKPRHGRRIGAYVSLAP